MYAQLLLVNLSWLRELEEPNESRGSRTVLREGLGVELLLTYSTLYIHLIFHIYKLKMSHWEVC
jgi:hypothetical protein